MGRKIRNIWLFLTLLLFIMACGNPNFDKFEGTGFSYQISADKTDIIRVRYTTDAGAPLIQLFDTKGKLKEEAIIAPNAPLIMNGIINDTIQITYKIGENDQMFLSWFKKNKYNPSRIGKYSIRYNYEIQNEYLENEVSEIDSLYIDKNTHIMSLFLKQKVIAKKPMYLFTVESSEITLYDPSSKSYIPYTFTDKRSIAEDYFKKVLALY